MHGYELTGVKYSRFEAHAPESGEKNIKASKRYD